MQSPDRDAAEARHIDTVPPVEAEDYPWAFAAAAQEDVPPPDRDPPKPDWYAPYEALLRDWSELIERVQQTGEPLFYAEGYADMIPRIQALIEMLENHQRNLSACRYVEDYLDAAVRHMDTHDSLQRVADGLGVPIVQISDHLGWKQEADRLMATAEAILADNETYGIHLDNMETGRVRVEGELSRLRHVFREDGEYASEVKKPEPAEPAWMPALRNPAPGLEQSHRRRQANRHPFFLCQGLCGHHPAHPGIDGELGYPGQITGTLDPGA